MVDTAAHKLKLDGWQSACDRLDAGLSTMKEKAATESLTVISAFVALVAGILESFGVSINVPGITASINDLLIIFGAVGAIYGRKRAQGPITRLTKGQ